MSAFAIQTLLYESVLRMDGIDAYGQIWPDGETLIAEGFERCEVSSNYWCLTPLHFYEGTDIVISTHHDGEWAYVIARTEAAYSSLSEPVRQRLERRT